MRVTIIADDNHVYVEGHAQLVDLTGLDEDIHAVQWYGTVGEIEFKYHEIENTRAPNQRFDDFSPFQVFVDRWMIEAQKEDKTAETQPQRPAESEPMSVLT